MPPAQTDDPARRPTGEPRSNTHANVKGEPSPRLPHERDESSDSVSDEQRGVIRQAHDDVASGQKDTDRGAVTNAVYRDSLRDRPSRG